MSAADKRGARPHVRPLLAEKVAPLFTQSEAYLKLNSRIKRAHYLCEGREIWIVKCEPRADLRHAPLRYVG